MSSFQFDTDTESLPSAAVVITLSDGTVWDLGVEGTPEFEAKAAEFIEHQKQRAQKENLA